MNLSKIIVAFLAFVIICSCEKYAVIVAGTQGFHLSYNVQSSAYHTYSTLVEDGNFRKENIILFSPDDVAFAKENEEFNGAIFSSPGYYSGNVRPSRSDIDYYGDLVTPDNIINVLVGNPMNVGSKRTLKSGPDDEVFLYIASIFGSDGVLALGNIGISTKYMYSDDLMGTLKRMQRNKKYAKMFIMLQGNEAGSLLVDLPNDVNIFAVASASKGKKAEEEYCNVKVKDEFVLPTCLAFKFSQNMFLRLNAGYPCGWSLEKWIQYGIDKTVYHNARFYGDFSIRNDTVCTFLYGS
eukprot:TRINITY_DN773140_c0_g1_i1.p1 TRINITY_DN773140_c0_g1~~TRINITY_DN773140_c0_g1_i1.p1  ORF type:complete len:295 (-),score=65.80 TRINITY_DN773140_c0_g1_i1:101-985(-)